MKLKTLVIAVLVLVGLSVTVHFATRPAPPSEADPRVGTPLLDRATATSATRLTISSQGASVTLQRDSNNTWKVSSYHNIPADFSKLARFISELTTTKIDRFVTANPERLSRLEFSDTTITLTDGTGKTLWSMTLGKTAENGGRFLRFPGADRAYLARLNVYTDATAKNWADTSLVSVEPNTIAKVELTFADGDPIIATRPTAEAPFTAADAPDDQQLKASAISSLVTTLTGLRFIDTAAFDTPDAVAAREHTRIATLTTFNGQTTTIRLGRRPEVPAPEPAPTDAKPEENAEPPAAAATPAGPVFVQVQSSNDNAWINTIGDELVFKISDYPFTNLPKTRADLFEPKPAPAPAASGSPAPRKTP